MVSISDFIEFNNNRDISLQKDQTYFEYIFQGILPSKTESNL